MGGGAILGEEVSMTSEYIEERNGGYYVAVPVFGSIP